MMLRADTQLEKPHVLLSGARARRLSVFIGITAQDIRCCSIQMNTRTAILFTPSMKMTARLIRARLLSKTAGVTAVHTLGGMARSFL